jgi:hypothetical protein
MPEITLNYWAILTTAAASMVIGSIWYAMPVFGKAWMRLAGLKPEQLKDGGKAMLVMVVGALLQAYVFAHVIDAFQGDTLVEGLTGGFFMWLGFVAIVTLNEVTFNKRPFKLWLIIAGYQLVNLLVGGVILSLWQ